MNGLTLTGVAMDDMVTMQHLSVASPRTIGKPRAVLTVVGGRREVFMVLEVID